jgi:pyruvate/2-oxoglutarate dehydrogenase complex dihydrolipoamide dehydrogenase (E3) component
MEQTANSRRFDAIVLGRGPAGEVVITQLSERGMNLALVERELVGGECAYWACIPSKTLLRVPEVSCEAVRTAGTSKPAQQWDEVREYRDYMIRNLDDSGEIKSYEDKGVRVFRGAGRFTGPGEVEVDGQHLASDRIVVATGSQTAVPPIPGLEQAGYWTNREATTLTSIPESVVILGGGPVGVELAQLLHRLGASVTLVEAGERLLSREDPRVSELLLEALREDCIDVRCEAEVSSVSTDDGHRVVRLAGGDEIRARAVGMTSQQAREAGIDVGTSHLQLDAAIARPWTYETDPRGELAVIADREREVLVGAWAVAPIASEWIHFAALAVKAQIPLAVLRDTVAQFPTYTEAYRKAIERLG